MYGLLGLCVVVLSLVSVFEGGARRGWVQGRDVIGWALMRALAGTARLPLTWLQLQAILIVWLRSFVQAHHLHQMMKTALPCTLHLNEVT